MPTLMPFQNAPSEVPIALQPAVSLERSACLESLAPAIRLVAEELGRPSSRRIRDFVTADGPATRIAYDRDALEYNRTFFLRNAIKCSTVSQILLTDNDEIKIDSVLDVGGGIGTFTLSLSRSGRSFDQLVVDSSAAQIDLGRRIVGSVRSGERIRWLFSHHIPYAVSQNQIALFSYSLCESPHLLRCSFERRYRTALVVDYPETISRCAEYASEIGARFSSACVSIALCSDLAEAIGQKNISANGALIVSD